VLFFGRMEYYKGLDVLVEAAREAEGRVPGLRVVVAGQGPELARCREAAADSTVFDWREGFVTDDSLPALFAECRAVVLPYREASQSGIVPLAFSCGRPVVATRVGALTEAVQDEVDGLLVAPDDPAAMASALVRLLTEPRLAETLSRGALATVTDGRMSRRSIARAHMAVYRRALGELP
jgi:glycosyltransferase involved in cell wall biosynthesis